MGFDFLDRIVLGTAGLGGVWGKVDQEESIKTVIEALEHGVSCIDTAPAYGDAEELLGVALKQWKGAAPFISTKVGRLKSFEVKGEHYDFSFEGMKSSIESSLKMLGRQQVDLLLLHDPLVIQPADAESAVNNLVELKRLGYTKHIGLGGNAPAWFLPYTRAGFFEVVMEFNRLNACNTESLETMLPFCNQRKLTYYAASPLNMGLLGASYSVFTTSPPEWLAKEQVDNAVRANAIALKYGISLAELSYRFLMSIPYDFKIVTGPGNRTELHDIFSHLNTGSLPEAIYNDIVQTTKKYLDESDRRGNL
ncbi:aldo/keto reductase [Pedobacter nyackensis]|uniref:aldo/keto reductase n=1 Tax=Pedobacter nyackensis TaxID=475255 RepID=UPI00292D6DA2|nr:aldo/keto reductase [Pedobacter nyackensis]